MLRYFTIVLFFLSTFFVSAQSQDLSDYYVAGIGFYNLENLFDTNDDEDVKDEEFTPNGAKAWDTDIYNQKLTDLATVIYGLGTEQTPDGLACLGVSEIENEKVLLDLVAQPELASRNYKIIHYDSPDTRGIDVAFLYQPDYFTPTSSKSIPVALDGSPTRDVLLVSGVFDGEKMHFIVNHWSSRRGGENVSGHKRIKGAQLCKGIIDSLSALDSNAKIVIMGDLNDGPKNESVKNHLGAKGKKKDVSRGDLYNPMFMYYMTGVGSLAHRDSWNIFDQIILSSGLVYGRPDGYKYYKTRIENSTKLVQKLGKYRGYPRRTFSGDNYQGGFSDHFPVYVYIVKPVK